MAVQNAENGVVWGGLGALKVSASAVTTLWRYTNLFIVIIIIIIIGNATIR